MRWAGVVVRVLGGVQTKLLTTVFPNSNPKRTPPYRVRETPHHHSLRLSFARVALSPHVATKSPIQHARHTHCTHIFAERLCTVNVCCACMLYCIVYTVLYACALRRVERKPVSGTKSCVREFPMVCSRARTFAVLCVCVSVLVCQPGCG